MRARHMLRRWPLLALVLVAASASLVAEQAPAGKKPVSYDMYNSWRSIQGTRVAPDGSWVVYVMQPQDGDGELVALNLKSGQERRHARGQAPVITADGRFVVFTIAPVKEEVDKAKKEKKPAAEQPKPGLGIMNLATGEVATVDRVKGFKVPEEGSVAAYLLEPPLKKAEEAKAEEKKAEEKKAEAAKAEAKKPEAKPGEKPAAKPKEKKKDPGNELVVRDLASGKTASIPDVTDYVWNKDGGWLAYAVSSKTPEKDGAFARRTSDQTTRSLLTGLGNYKQLAFDERGAQLAFVSDRDEYKNDASAYKLYHWETDAQSAAELVAAKAAGMPAGMTVSENGQLQFSKDGARLFLGTAAIPKSEPEDAPEPVKVDIWSWTDSSLQPMQKVRADQDKKQSFRAVVHLKDKKFVQLASTDVPSIELSEDASKAIAESDVPYRKLVSWDAGHQDIYAINLADGSKRKFVEKSRFGGALSPGGNYILLFDEDDYNWYTIRVSDGRKSNLTYRLGVHFENESTDTPEPARGYGSAGWTEDDKSVLLYDQYDIWEVSPDGSNARMITGGHGRKNGLVFRYQRLDPEQRTIKAGSPLLLTAVNDATKASGFYKVAFDGKSEPVKLVMADKQLGGVVKAKNAETVVYTQQRFDEFPDLWVSDTTFASSKKISNANPQMAEYVWGRSELIEYFNADGKKLKAILTKPENFDPSKKYPLMVYIYEELTNGLHRFSAPAPGTSINLTRYVSNGYVLLQPDIIYTTGYPGEAAEKCVIPAVNTVLAMGFVDPARVGIQGHSWGGYQITHLITRTDIFAAVQAGASVTNMTSAYGGIRWGTGMSRAFQYERTQSRIGAPPWMRPLQFIENSPLFWVEKVTTPYLTIHNDEDDAVPWYQGIEFFSALRRLDKPAWMFVYNGERHGLRDRENMKHWTIHQDEFFDHYLKGAPKPEWMEKGVSFLEKGKRDVSGYYKKKTTS